jgi:CheY-like chemotaxis protein
MIRIAIIDDHAIVRAGLRQFFSEQVDLTVVAEAANGREAVDIVRKGQVDVLVMDLSMPDQSGVDALAAIKARAPDLPVLILSGFPEEHYATTLLRQGAAAISTRIATRKRSSRRSVLFTAAASTSPLASPSCSPTAWEGGDKPAHEQLSERRVPGVPASGQGRDHRPHGQQRMIAEREDGEHVPDPGDGEDEARIERRPDLLRAEERADPVGRPRGAGQESALYSVLPSASRQQ